MFGKKDIVFIGCLYSFVFGTEVLFGTEDILLLGFCTVCLTVSVWYRGYCFGKILYSLFHIYSFTVVGVCTVCPTVDIHGFG